MTASVKSSADADDLAAARRDVFHQRMAASIEESAR
jgi:hypothetical protein